MEHADNPVLHGHDWAIATWTIIAIAILLGITSNLTLQLFRTHSPAEEGAISSAVSEIATTGQLAIGHQHTFPIVLTIPFAVTRTQRMMVARAQHRAALANHLHHLKSDLKAAPGFVAGLAIMGASQSSSH